MSAMGQGNWMIYGANGYTGRLVAELAAERGLRPVLAGRNRQAIEEMGQRLDLPTRVFGLQDPSELRRRLQDLDALLLTAGPFSHTSASVVDACIDNGTHYLDITGEIDVLEQIFRRSERAAQAGCALVPGVGFDVVPTDCLAALLARALPQAQNLQLGFWLAASPSAGTAKTTVEGITKGSAIRRNGVIERVPHASLARRIRFSHGEFDAMAIPWGDVVTAYESTGIPNVTVFVASSEMSIRAMRVLRPLLNLARVPALERFVKRRIEKKLAGPSESQRTRAGAHLWGRVETSDGVFKEALLDTIDGYSLTAQTALESTVRVLASTGLRGALTPSKAFGAEYILEFAGTKLRWVPDARTSSVAK